MDTGRTETDKLRYNQEETDLGDLCRSRSPCSTALQLSVHHADRERGDGGKLATVREREMTACLEEKGVEQTERANWRIEVEK